MVVEEKSETTVTLDDLDLALRIIDTFLKRYEKATRLLRRLSSVTGGRKRIEDMIFEMAVASTLGKKLGTEEAETEEPELSPEELEYFRKRARELAKRIERSG